MKKIIIVIFSLFIFTCSAMASGDYSAPVPSADDEVTTSGPNTKFSQVTQMRYDAFKDVEVTVDIDIPEERKNIQFYALSKDGAYLRRVKLQNAKVSEFTNGTFEVVFKNTKDTIFKYNKQGELTGFALIKNDGKIPFVTYHYDNEGKICLIEVKPRYFYSYVYGLDGLLVEYKIDDKTYNNCGQLIKRKKSILF